MDKEQLVQLRRLARARLFEKWRSENVADRGQWIGYAASASGFLVAFGLVIICQPRVLHPEPLLGLLLLLMGAALPLGILSGWLAHRLFYRTLVPVSWMAIAFALLADFTVLGWLYLIISPD